jgi:hypothetical protein
MVLAFILVVYIDGLAHDTGGTPAFRSVISCGEYARWIETTGQTWASERVYKYNTKIEAYCVPKFLPKKTQFWD